MSVFHSLPVFAVSFFLLTFASSCTERQLHAETTGTPTTQSSGKFAKATTVYIRDIPHVSQRPDFCGEACVEMWLQKLGVNADQNDVFNLSGLDPELARGCYTRELVQAIRALGFDPGKVGYTIQADQARAGLDKIFRSVYEDLKAGIPSILCMRTGNGADATEHFRLVVGYDAKSDEIVYHEPAAERNGANRRMTRRQLYSVWPLKYHSGVWTVISIRLAGTPRAPPATEGLTPADFAQHLLELKKNLPKGFHTRIQSPFVVIGNETPAMVKMRSLKTVKWSVDHLQKLYFPKDPDHVINIWLFKDKASYEQGVPKLVGYAPHTPFGFYSSTHKVLVMNIATGGGTLVHEIVHPLMRANFPECASWFDEGLASLYEQCGDRNGKIWGFTNWRLKGLQDAIRADRVPGFKTLCHTTRDEFYEEDPGTNYSQARYLCYWLQARGLLQKFFNAYQANVDADPGGYKTLQKIIGEDMEKWTYAWKKWVLTLRFP